MTEHLSYSQLRTLLQCPRAYEYRYILRKPDILRGRMLLGRAYDHVVSSAAAKKVLFGELMSSEEAADSFSSFWEKELSDKLVYDELGDEKVEAAIVDFGEDDPGRMKDSGIKLAQKYIAEYLPALDITDIQKRLVVDICPHCGYQQPGIGKEPPKQCPRCGVYDC